MHDLTHAGALVGGHRGQQAARQVAGQMLHQVDLLVDIQGVQGVEDGAVAHLVDQIVPDVFRGFEQHLTALVVLHQPPQGVALFRR